MSDNLKNSTECIIREVIMVCSREYNFDGEEALRKLNVKVNVVSESKKVKGRGDRGVGSGDRGVGSGDRGVGRSSILMPYSGEKDDICCESLRYSEGLYTQCKNIRGESGSFCKKCEKNAEKNNGVAEYGTINDRLKAYTEGIEYKDPSGKSPVDYGKIMKKYKLSREQVEEEASRLNIKINPIHFEEKSVKKSGRPVSLKKKPEGETKPKGRPKKAKKVLELAGEEEDLFASLVMSANKNDSGSKDKDNVDEDADTVIMTESEGEEEEKLSAKLAGEEEAKLSAKLAGEEEAKLSAKLAAEKESKKKATEDEKETKKKAAEEKKEAKKKAAEEKKEAERLEKEAKKKAADEKKEAERLEKEAKKKAAEEEKPKKETKKDTKKEAKKDTKEEEYQDVVKTITYEGKKYLKSIQTGIIYNMDQDVIGKWNEGKQRIEFDEVAEESCDEYDE